MTAPLVSVIVTTRNEEAVLGDLLRSILDQDYTNVEAIVIDNGSSDRTKEVAALYTRNVYDKGPERSVQRNYGVERSHGDFLLILDADMRIPPNVISDCVRTALEDCDVKGIIVSEQSFGANFWARCRALERSCYVGDETIEAERFFDRQAYLSIGGYDPDLWGGEDWDLSQRFRAKFRYGRVTSMILHNEGRLSLVKVMRKKFYYAPAAARYAKRHRAIALRQANLLVRPAFLRSWKRLVAHPVLLLGILVLKSLEMLAAAAGIAWSVGRGHNVAKAYEAVSIPDNSRRKCSW